MDQQYQGTNIEILEEILELLRITEEYTLDKNKTIELETLEIILTILVIIPVIMK